MLMATFSWMKNTDVFLCDPEEENDTRFQFDSVKAVEKALKTLLMFNTFIGCDSDGKVQISIVYYELASFSLFSLCACACVRVLCVCACACVRYSCE
jgi:hypothetical protein